jgi:GT2 family glycosyltransferase
MSTAKSNPSIAVVVVTYNRLALLQECIAALHGQTRPPDEIIVVNNGSTDGTADWLAAQADLTVVTQGNLGSSGGQYAGIRTAYQKGHGWFWCMDDDTIPESEALERLTVSPYFRDARTGFLSSVVLWTDGQPHLGNELCPSHATEWCKTVLDDRCVRVTYSTFVSLLLCRVAVSAVGLPIKELFIWGDDHEYTGRISAKYVNYCVLDSRVIHKTTRNVRPGYSGVADLAKYCYLRRNQIWLVRNDSTLGRWDRLMRILTLYYHELRKVALRSVPASVILWMLRGHVCRFTADAP